MAPKTSYIPVALARYDASSVRPLRAASLSTSLRLTMSGCQARISCAMAASPIGPKRLTPKWMLNCSTCTIRGGRRAHFSGPLIGATWSGARTVGVPGHEGGPAARRGVSDGAVGDTEGNWSGRSAVLVGSTPNAHAPMARAGTTTTTATTLSQAIRRETWGLWLR